VTPPSSIPSFPYLLRISLRPELCPAVFAVIRIMPDVARERERLSAFPALPAHDPGNLMLIPILLLTLPAEIRNMIPGWIIKDGFSAALAGFLQQFLFFGDFHNSLRLAREQFFQPGEQNVPPIILYDIATGSSFGSFVPSSPRKALARMDFFISSILTIMFSAKVFASVSFSNTL